MGLLVNGYRTGYAGTTDAIRAFDHRHVATRAAQVVRGDEAVDTGSNYEDFRIAHAPVSLPRT